MDVYKVYELIKKELLEFKLTAYKYEQRLKLVAKELGL